MNNLRFVLTVVGDKRLSLGDYPVVNTLTLLDAEINCMPDTIFKVFTKDHLAVLAEPDSA